MKSLIDGNCLSEFFKDSKAPTCFFPWSSIVFVCFSKVFPNGE